MNCLHCNSKISPEDINIKKDSVLCRNCNTVFSASQEYASCNSNSNFDISSPPRWAWIRQRDNAIVIGASNVTWQAFLFIPFFIIWLVVMSSTWNMPDFPGHEHNGFSPFNLPFIIGPAFFIVFSTIMIAGKTVVSFDKEMGRVFVGVGSIGWSKKFYWRDIDYVKEIGPEGKTRGRIVLDGKTRISFGSLLSDERRYYLCRALQHMHAHIRSGKSLPLLHISAS